MSHSGDTAGAAGETKETSRIEAFSDGVFAIAITLLVLERKVPHADSDAGLARALLAEWPAYLAFFTSFATITIMWINHHVVLGLVRRVDAWLLLWNALLLMLVSVVPFPTSLVSRTMGHPGERVAAAVYCGVGLAIALAFTGLWRYATSPRRHPRLLRVPPDDPRVRSLNARYRFGPLCYLVALVLAPLNANASMAMALGLALVFAIPHPEPRAD